MCVDDDDPRLNDYAAAVPAGFGLVVGERRTLTGWLNHVATLNVDRYPIIGLFGDDVRPRTPGWDTAIARAMRPLGVVYGNDCHQGGNLPTHPFLDSAIIRRIGWMAPPEIAHLYIDNVWKAIGEHFGTLTYLPDVVLEHMHPHAGKAEMDDGYREVNSKAAYKDGRAAFDAYMAERFAADMERVAADD